MNPSMRSIIPPQIIMELPDASAILSSSSSSWSICPSRVVLSDAIIIILYLFVSSSSVPLILNNHLLILRSVYDDRSERM